MIWRTVLQSRHQATAAIGRWIEGFYNPVRRHSTLDYVSPIAFERAAAQSTTGPPPSAGKSSSVRSLLRSRIFGTDRSDH